uniref:Uncharacterized protein n=1 Tax=Arundo donax TaxID=35708 RepID=A0A0A9DSJ5_ARUDO
MLPTNLELGSFPTEMEQKRMGEHL